MNTNSVCNCQQPCKCINPAYERQAGAWDASVWQLSEASPTECVNHLRFGCKCPNCWWEEPGRVLLTEKEQERRNEEARRKLQALMQTPSVVEKPADEPIKLEPWRLAIIDQIRAGKTLKTIRLAHDEWPLFIDGCKTVNV